MSDLPTEIPPVTSNKRRSRFVRPDASVRCDLSDSDWILIRGALTYGDKQRLQS